MNAEALDDGAITWADMVFVSALLVQRASFEDVVARCNRAGRKVVAGGPFPTAMHDEIEGVDHFVLNEAEVTLPRFLHDLEKERRAESIRRYKAGQPSPRCRARSA